MEWENWYMSGGVEELPADGGVELVDRHIPAVLVDELKQGDSYHHEALLEDLVSGQVPVGFLKINVCPDLEPVCDLLLNIDFHLVQGEIGILGGPVTGGQIPSVGVPEEARIYEAADIQADGSLKSLLQAFPLGSGGLGLLFQGLHPALKFLDRPLLILGGVAGGGETEHQEHSCAYNI